MNIVKFAFPIPLFTDRQTTDLSNKRVDSLPLRMYIYLKTEGHGRLLENMHRNHSVMYIVGVIS